ncbi:MAG: hypothetical protein LQ342_000967 [Letrouitia transgressa]|nr:MAG: hypothetical protein LQ342_000967 [Letrouitia transgressa]
MASSNPSSTDPSRVPSPSPTPVSRFTSQGATAEDLLKSQTVGLVHLNDFRKRRAEALEQKEREAQGTTFGRFTSASSSGAVTPNTGVSTPNQPPKKKRRPATKGKLSFGVEDEDDESAKSAAVSNSATPRPGTPDVGSSRTASPASGGVDKKRIGPNANVEYIPKVMTKAALLREAQTREQLRKEFLAMQEAVKATEIVIPFVFYDGTNIPGGACKVKKGDYIWLFLDRSRKLGAEMGVGGGDRANSRKEWARVGVDDLMLVRGEIIIPHHFEFYYFIVNKTLGHAGAPIFDFSSTKTLPNSDSSRPSVSPSTSPEPSDYDPISRPGKNNSKRNNGLVTPADGNLEGVHDDPNHTKVVDRRWYERNKHIFPASVWEEYDPGKDYSKGMRRDAQGNPFFFS